MKDPMQSTYGCRFAVIATIAVAGIITLGGCGPNYRELRIQGQQAMIQQSYGPARYFFLKADEKKARRPENLHDLGVCSVMLARQKFAQRNEAAAMRELDAAIGYYRQAIDASPGHQAAIEGLNIALELKGQFDEALKTAEWAAKFVGPAAKQYLFLAQELEERGDIDGALLRYRQAVAVEPNSAEAHRTFAKFLLSHDNEEAAVYHLQTAYRLDPANAWVVDELAARGALPHLTAEETSAP